MYETKREIAAKVLRDIFSKRQRVPIAEAVEAAKKEGISRRTLLRAATDLGVETVPNGPFPAFWETKP